MSKGNLILATLLALQGALLGVRAVSGGTGGPGAAASREGTPLLPGITAAQVAAIQVKDATDTSIELKRSGDGWVIATAGDYPAKAENVTRVLDKVLGLKSVGVATTTRASHAGLEVADGKAQRDVKLLGGDGKELARVFLGRTMAGGGFVRKAGEDAVQRVEEAITWDVSTAPSSYVDTQLLSFDSAQATSLRITNSKGRTIELTSENDAWKMRVVTATAEAAPQAGTATASIDAAKDKVTEVLGSISRVWFTKPVAAAARPEHGFDKPALVVEAKLKDGAVHKLEVGAAVSGGTGRYARKGGGPNVVEIGDYTFTALDKEPEHFTPPPPAPATPSPEGGAPGAPPIARPGE